MRTPNDGAPRIFEGNLITGYSNGLFDLRSFNSMDVFTGNGYGGGSLIYAAVKLEPTVPNFDDLAEHHQARSARALLGRLPKSHVGSPGPTKWRAWPRAA